MCTELRCCQQGVIRQGPSATLCRLRACYLGKRHTFEGDRGLKRLQQLRVRAPSSLDLQAILLSCCWTLLTGSTATRPRAHETPQHASKEQLRQMSSQHCRRARRCMCARRSQAVPWCMAMAASRCSAACPAGQLCALAATYLSSASALLLQLLFCARSRTLVRWRSVQLSEAILREQQPWYCSICTC